MIPEKNLAYLTENFRALQGLRLIPVGLFFLFTSATRLHWIPVWEGDQTFTLLLAVIAILANIFIGKYYARTYGTVKRRETTFRRDILIGLSFVVLIIFLVWLENQTHLQIYILGLVLAYYCILYWWIQKGITQKHYLIMGILIAIISCLPALYIFPIDVFRNTSGLFFAAFLIVGGIFDHLILVRHLQKIPEKTNDTIV